MRHASAPVFTLAHLSDVHLGPLPWMSIRDLTVKRCFGAANWTINRHKAHLPEMADAVRRAVLDAKPEHVVVSGDLTNLGLPREVKRVRLWLEALGPPDFVSVVPGNHDLYVPEVRPVALDAWAPYMTSDARGRAQCAEGWPYLRILAEPSHAGQRGVALIGVNSAEPRPLFNASGAVGDAQRQRLAALLRALDGAYARVVVIHHPPLPGLGHARTAPTELAAPFVGHPSDLKRGLNDAVAMGDLLTAVGAELVLHGHNHCDMLSMLMRQGHPPIPIVGARSASLAEPHGGEDRAGYTWIEIERVIGGAIRVTPRAVD